LGGRCLGFKAGQWVDFFVIIDGAEAIADFSITSSPADQGRIDLAVKLVGDNAATHYLHDSARVGDQIEVRLGGEFYYTSEMADSIVLIAGGIGLTPLMSIMRYVDDSTSDVKAVLVYSAEAPSELLFKEELDDMAALNPRIRCLYTVTRAGNEPWRGSTSRIDAKLLVGRADVDPAALYYVCGPPPMIQSMLTLLRNMDVPSSRIHYEQWW
jgi:ferredoxin-NADP reductase